MDMKNLFLSILAGLVITTAVNANDTFKVKVDQPGVKPLKYDVYIPDGAKNLPFFDWKPDQETKDIFAQYGVPYAADMMRFFDEVFYK